MEIKTVPLTSKIKQRFRSSLKYKEVRSRIEELLAQEDSDQAIEVKTGPENFSRTVDAVRGIVYSYNQELGYSTSVGGPALMTRTRKDSNTMYIIKKTNIGFDKYLR